VLLDAATRSPYGAVALGGLTAISAGLAGTALWDLGAGVAAGLGSGLIVSVWISIRRAVELERAFQARERERGRTLRKELEPRDGPYRHRGP
jgi:hypothetical protein